jgi:hypothetical protein
MNAGRGESESDIANYSIRFIIIVSVWGESRKVVVRCGKQWELDGWAETAVVGQESCWSESLQQVKSNLWESV